MMWRMRLVCICDQLSELKLTLTVDMELTCLRDQVFDIDTRLLCAADEDGSSQVLAVFD